MYPIKLSGDLLTGGKKERPLYETDQVPDSWDDHHDSLWAIFSEFGEVSGETDIKYGFYHTLDCYNIYDDGFLALGARSLDPKLTLKVQSQLKNYLDGAMVFISGCPPGEEPDDSPLSILGLEMVITADQAYISWYKSSVRKSLKILKNKGFIINDD